MKFVTVFLVVFLILVAFVRAQDSLMEEETPAMEVYSDDVDPQTLGIADTLRCQQIYGRYCGPGYCAGKWWGSCPDVWSNTSFTIREIKTILL